jgi:DNA repair protein RecO (recombination protein O)
MLYKTRGIAIHSTKFSETSIIVRIYTERFGLRPYIIKGIRKEHSRIRPGLFQPLTLLDLTVYNKEKSSLQTVREAAIAFPYQTVPFDILKSSVALYVSELVYKSIREEEPNQGLFDFLWDFCTNLDSSMGSLNLIPLHFTVHLTRFLGILPRQDYSAENRIFNLKEGSFQKGFPDHDFYLEDPLSGFLARLLSSESAGMEEPDIPSQARGILLDKMLQYYRLHLSGFPGIRSHTILHTVLS